MHFTSDILFIIFEYELLFILDLAYISHCGKLPLFTEFGVVDFIEGGKFNIHAKRILRAKTNGRENGI